MTGVAVVSGASGGIGRWVALGLAQAGCHVVMTGRDPGRGEAALAWLRQQAPRAQAELMLADLSSLADTAALGARIVAAHPRLRILVNNAGIFQACPSRTVEGHDRMLAVNLLSPFVLMGALLPALQTGGPARIVTVGSSTSDRARIDPEAMDRPQGWGMLRGYSQSKLAVMMITFEQARRLAGSDVVANVVHPGLVATRIVRSPGPIGLAWRLMAPWMRSERDGAATPLFAALSAAGGAVSGRYFKDCAEARCNPIARDDAMLGRVWTATENLVGIVT